MQGIAKIQTGLLRILFRSAHPVDTCHPCIGPMSMQPDCKLVFLKISLQINGTLLIIVSGLAYSGYRHIRVRPQICILPSTNVPTTPCLEYYSITLLSSKKCEHYCICDYWLLANYAKCNIILALLILSRSLDKAFVT